MAGGEEMGLLNCGGRKSRGKGGLGICCGKNNEALIEEDFSSDKPIAYPVHTNLEAQTQNQSATRDSRFGLKVLLAVLCVSLLLGVLVFLFFSSSSSSNSSSGGEVSSSSSSSGTAGAGGAAGAGGTAGAGTSTQSQTPVAPAPRPPSLQFYMYRAQTDDASFSPENLNLADLAGVMWYLHNDVVVEAPRRYRIDRIKRWKVTMRTTQEYWNVHHRHFGPFVSFDDTGRCTGNCGSPSSLEPDASFRQYGFLVGCEAAETSQSGYKASVITRNCDQTQDADCQPRAPILYSLPGECPTKAFEEGHPQHDAGSSAETKDDACRQANPGGRCSEAPTGAPDCTFRMEDAGEISLNELAGFTDQQGYDTWWQNNTGHDDWNNVEYLLDRPEGGRYDRGVNWNWWDHKFDEDRCTERIEHAERLFTTKFPEFGQLEEPPCDFDAWYQDEFTWAINHTLAVTPSRGFEWTA